MSSSADRLNEINLKIMYYIHHSGPVFVKKLAARLNSDTQTVRAAIQNLLDTGHLERVTKTLLDYRIDRRNKVTKHRNHTYFDLTRKGKLFMRNYQGEVDVNLRPPYKQA